MRMGIRAQLFAAFGALLALMGVLGAVSIVKLASINDLTDALYEKHTLGLSYIMQANVDLIASGRAEKNAILASDRAEGETHAASARKSLAAVSDDLNKFKTVVVLEETRRQIAKVEQDLRELSAGREQVLKLALEGKDQEAKAEAAKVRQVADRVDTGMNELQSGKEKLADQASDEATSTYQAARLQVLGLIAFSLLLGVGVAYYLARRITSSVVQIATAADGLSRGDLEQKVTVASRDELGAMADSFRTMMGYQREIADVASLVAQGDLTVSVTPKSERDVLGNAFFEMIAGLREVVTNVKASAEGVAGTSSQLGQAANQTSGVVQQVTQAIQNVAAGSQESSRAAQSSNEAVSQLGLAIDSIAKGASEQARQVQAVSATATQMAAGVEQVASNAQNVASASQQTRASAEHGAKAVRDTVDGMAEIKLVVSTAAGKVEELGKLGEKIGAVVETIDDIAEQTNLLALNAAIEAARAGEHGRGFAVVADEVRKLAERSQRETKAIADLIREVQAGTKDAVAAMEQGSVKVEQGSERADEAGRALSEILQAVESTVAQVTQIAAAAREMAAGARGVVDAMGSISAVVEENSAATEEMAAQAGAVTGSIESIAAVSEENTAATEEVSASAEEMSAQVEEMNAQAEELAATAEQLNLLVARFRLDGGANASVAARRRTASPLRRAS
ncbi:MAG: MCP four helix bundle domain-containing protein [Chloroflexi bacterium]|nr:MCP four helix bundle domain-containing protein [Chloroflexota bacterium]